MTEHVIVDLETLGTKSDAVILSIGAVRFDPYENDNWDTLVDTFYELPHAETQTEEGRTITFDTVRWWTKQNALAQAEVFTNPGRHPQNVLKEWAEFCKGAKAVWGNGNMFDCAILRNACEQYKVDYPVPFWGDYDLRTIKWAAGNPRLNLPKGIEHHALDDAKHEALCLQEYMRKLR